MANRDSVLAFHDEATAVDDEIVVAAEEAADEVAFGAAVDDPYTFGAKVEELRKKLDKLRARIEKLEAKESKGPFAKMQDKLREKRLASLEKKAERLEDQLEAAENAKEDKAEKAQGLFYGRGGARRRQMRRQMAMPDAAGLDPDARDRYLHRNRLSQPTPIAWAPNLVSGARSDGQWADPDERDRALHLGWVR